MLVTVVLRFTSCKQTLDEREEHLVCYMLLVLTFHAGRNDSAHAEVRMFIELGPSCLFGH